MTGVSHPVFKIFLSKLYTPSELDSHRSHLCTKLVGNLHFYRIQSKDCFFLCWEHNGYQASVLYFWSSPNGLFVCNEKSVEENPATPAQSPLKNVEFANEAGCNTLQH